MGGRRIDMSIKETSCRISHDTRIAVVGLGYVGLPLAIAIAPHFKCVGFDISRARVTELKNGVDRTDEISEERLLKSTLALTDDANDMRGCDLFIVTVPTPVDDNNRPDLGAVRASCRTLGPIIVPGAIVVFESTVYPGVTEDICGPELEAASGLRCGVDFHLGYSPERINPGDREHTVDRIQKVIAGQTDGVSEALAQVYGKVTTGGVFRAASIKVAEAAKVIENAQRDINIAFINEIAMIFQRIGISTYDVLAAAGTKWNFLSFEPGLVGGHCIGVDPYYLAHRAQELDHEPDVILAGRKINEAMGPFIARRIAEQLDKGSRILVLGLTFKENVPDLRNSKVIDVIRGLEAHGMLVDVHDCHADPDEAEGEYGLRIKQRLNDILPTRKSAWRGDDRRNNHEAFEAYDCVVGAVPHDLYRKLEVDQLSTLVSPTGLVADIKGMWRGLALPEGVRRWQL